MHIPKYWAREHGVPPSGRPPRVDVWGWSDESVDDAVRLARERLAEVIARAEAEGGLPEHRDDYYPRVPLREPVVARVGDDDDLLGLITRNRYGAEVLNTERIFVADVDVPEWETREPGSGGGFLRRKVTSVEEVVERVRRPLADLGDRAWLIYRTRAGLRVIVGGSDLEPGGIRATSLLAALGADPLYVQLTRTYDSYRARLSPKPWRVGVKRLPIGERVFVDDGLVDDERWVAAYDRAVADFAVCRFVTGSGRAFDARAQQLIDLHDELTGTAMPERPLA